MKKSLNFPLKDFKVVKSLGGLGGEMKQAGREGPSPKAMSSWDIIKPRDGFEEITPDPCPKTSQNISCA